MVQHVTREEERSRRHDSVFAEREAELEQMASKMPRTVGRFPYLMEINTGVVHPWTEAMAERSDLVVGCYNLEGSQNPEDADPNYNPQRAVIRGETLRKRVDVVAPRTVAEQKAHDAEVEGRVRRELAAQHQAELDAERERIRQEVMAEMALTGEQKVDGGVGHNVTVDEPQTVEDPAKPVGKKGNKGRSNKAAAPVVPEPTTPAEPTETADAAIDVGADADLNAAFAEAMK